MGKGHKEPETVAAFVHGALFGLHALGAFYNLKKKNYIYSAIHAGAAIFDLVGTIKHLETSEEEDAT